MKAIPEMGVGPRIYFAFKAKRIDSFDEQTRVRTIVDWEKT